LMPTFGIGFPSRHPISHSAVYNTPELFDLQLARSVRHDIRFLSVVLALPVRL
jgi:hypothetical protein